MIRPDHHHRLRLALLEPVGFEGVSVTGVVALIIDVNRVEAYFAVRQYIGLFCPRKPWQGDNLLLIFHFFSSGVKISGIHLASMFLRALFNTSICCSTGSPFLFACARPRTAFSSFVASYESQSRKDSWGLCS